MSKVIIGVHGLGNKPRERVLEIWWKASIRESSDRKFIHQNWDKIAHANKSVGNIYKITKTNQNKFVRPWSSHKKVALFGWLTSLIIGFYWEIIGEEKTKSRSIW